SEIYRGDVSPHSDDTDQAQATTLYREVLDDEARGRLAGNIAGHVSKIDPSETELLERVYAYWTAVDPDLGNAVRTGVESGPRGNHRRQE
ncbi:MAG: catalase-related domain-containing protein, partial [Dietzia sp.]